jgi:hypothetical protein
MGSNFDQTIIDRQRSHGLMGLDRARRKSPAMRGKVTEQLRLRLRTLGLGKIAHQLQRSREHRIGLPSSMAAPAMRRPLQVFDGSRPIRLRADPDSEPKGNFQRTIVRAKACSVCNRL